MTARVQCEAEGEFQGAISPAFGYSIIFEPVYRINRSHLLRPPQAQGSILQGLWFSVRRCVHQSPDAKEDLLEPRVVTLRSALASKMEKHVVSMPRIQSILVCTVPISVVIAASSLVVSSKNAKPWSTVQPLDHAAELGAQRVVSCYSSQSFLN